MSRKIKLFFLIFVLFLICSGKYSKADVPKLKIISRVEWGADEIKRFKEDKLIWPEEYAGVKKIIIHHTAGSDGGNDPKATVRAIYDWHSKGRGWGDVGYNYLIDPQGNIYEGRNGGEGVMGGHAYDDAKKVGWNRGTIGISILGTYGGWVSEPKPGYYLEHPEIYPNGTVKNERMRDDKWQILIEKGINAAAEESLSSLIAVKSLDFGFTPDGESNFQGRTLPNVVGHRDVDSTACPGDGLYKQLSEIRQKARAKYDVIISQGVKQKATLVGNKEINLQLKKDETREVILQFRNDGDLTWHNYTDDKVILADASVKSRLALLGGFHLAAVPEQIATTSEEIEIKDYKLQEYNVKPGEVGTFKIKLNYPKDKLIETKDLVLAMQDKGWFSGTEVKVKAAALDLSFKGELEAQNMPVAMLENSKKDVVIKFRNSGIKAWYKNEKGKDAKTGSVVYLKIMDKTTGGRSKFHDKSWTGELGLIRPQEDEITPGNSATFKIKLYSETLELYRTKFSLMRSTPELEDIKEAEINGCAFDTLTRIDSPLQADLIEANIPSAMLNIWTSKAEIKIKNTGSVVWDKNLVLKVLNQDGKESVFKDKSWRKDSASASLPTKVKPGQAAILSLKLKAPKSPGLYNVVFALEYKNKPVYVSYNKNLVYSIRVDDNAKPKGNVPLEKISNNISSSNATSTPSLSTNASSTMESGR